MRAPSITLAVPLLLAGFLPGCRDFHAGEVRPVDHTLLKAESKRSAGEATVSPRSINPDLILRGDGTTARTTLSFVAEEADSLPLMASWSELPVAEIVRSNGFGREPFGPGRSVTLELAPVAAARFNALRDVHLDKWRHRKVTGQEPVDVVEHVMAKDETLADLLERYPTTEDLLARENGDLNLTVLREGRKVRVPVLSKVERPAPVEAATPAPAAGQVAAKPADKAAEKPADKAVAKAPAKVPAKAAAHAEKASGKAADRAAKPVERAAHHAGKATDHPARAPAPRHR